MYRIRYLLIATVLAITSVVSTQKIYAEQLFWIDGKIAEAQANSPGNATIDISALSTGLHWLTITEKNETGVWSSPVTKCFIVPVKGSDKSIVEHQYWIDGKMETIVTQGQQPAAINISELAPGIHTLSVRVKDNTGLWSSQLTKNFIVPVNSLDIADKKIVEHQYWIDGKMEASVTQSEQFSVIDVKTLAPGIHTLAVRVKDNNGLWSSQLTKNFIVPVNRLDVADKKIVEHQYWIDGRMEASVTQSEQPSIIDIETLAPGIHTLAVRVKDNDGLWSSQVIKNFIIPTKQLNVADKNIVEHQYWIDDKMEASVTQSEQPSVIDLKTLTPGLHAFSVRVKDNSGAWSSQVSKNFIVPYKEFDVSGKMIVEHQYWIDGKMEARVTQSEQPSVIDVKTLSPGIHSFSVRVKDNTGAWSSQVTKFFTYNGDEMKETAVTHCLYWFNNDMANIKVMPIDAESGAINIDISELAAGTHTLGWRFRGANGALSEARTMTFESYSFIDYTIPNNSLGTFSYKYNMTLPDGLKAYFCTNTEMEDEELAVKILRIDGNIVNGGTGVLLSGEPGVTYRLRYTDDNGSAPEGNSLVAVMEQTDIPAVFGEYINFTMQSGIFVKLEDTASMPANSAYLQQPASEVGDASVIVISDPNRITQDSDGYYLIGSLRHWKDFAEIVKTNNYANAKMIADVDLGDDQTHIGTLEFEGRYSGIFDGQGHTLTVAYVTNSNVASPFAQTDGATIKNLHVAGSIKSAYDYVGVVGRAISYFSGPSDAPSITKLSNVWSSLTIEVTSSTAYNNVAAFIGGFPDDIYQCGRLIMDDCLFTGSIKSLGSGYFIGLDTKARYLTIRNSLFTGTIDAIQRFIFKGTYINCYIKGDNVTDEELADGSIATALQGGRGKQVWQQDSQMGIPMLSLFSDTQEPAFDTTYTIYFDTFNSKWRNVKLYVDGVEAVGTLVKYPYIKSEKEKCVEGYLHKYTVNITDASKVSFSNGTISFPLVSIDDGYVYYYSKFSTINYGDSPLSVYEGISDGLYSHRISGTILGDGSEGTYKMVYYDGLWLYEGDNFVQGSFYITDYECFTGPNDQKNNHYAASSDNTEVKIGEATASLKYDNFAVGTKFTSNVTGKATLVFDPQNNTIMFVNPMSATATRSSAETIDGSMVNKLEASINVDEYTPVEGPYTISDSEFTTTSSDAKFTNLPYAVNYTLKAGDGTVMPINIDLPVEPMFNTTIVNAEAVVVPTEDVNKGYLVAEFQVKTTWTYNLPHIICFRNDGKIIEGVVNWTAGGFIFIASDAVPVFNYSVTEDVSFDFLIIPEYPFMVNTSSTGGNKSTTESDIQNILGTPVIAIAEISGGSGVATGIGNVSVDEQEKNMRVEYYNLQGQRIFGSHITPGIYIRRTPTKTEKVIIK